MQIIREPFILGNTYRTVGGDLVKLVKVSNEGTMYETMACKNGVHRYTTRDFGRVTATDHKKPDPLNLVVLYRVEAEHFDVPHRWKHEIEADNKALAAHKKSQREWLIQHAKDLGKDCPAHLKKEVRKLKKEMSKA